MLYLGNMADSISVDQLQVLQSWRTYIRCVTWKMLEK